MFKFFTTIFAATLVLFSLELNAVEEGLRQGSTGGEAAKTGVNGSQFLKIGVGPRGTGMAGAFGSLADDLTAIHWNPAGIAEIPSISANFNYTSWIAGFDHSFGALSFPMGSNYTLAVSATSFGKSGIPITTIQEDNDDNATYSINDISFGVSFGGYLTEEFSFGITAKYVDNSIATLSANTFAFDIGTKYDVGIYGLKLGFSIHNLGTEMSFDGEDLSTSRRLYDGMNASPIDAGYTAYPFGMPLIFRASISSEIINLEEHKLITAFDFNTLSDVSEQFAFGAEYTWNKFLSVRGGYILGKDQMGIAGGIGLNYLSGTFNGRFDYSVNPMTDLGLIHRIGLNLNFGN
jgi:hypothetical protein